MESVSSFIETVSSPDMPFIEETMGIVNSGMTTDSLQKKYENALHVYNDSYDVLKGFFMKGGEYLRFSDYRKTYSVLSHKIKYFEKSVCDTIRDNLSPSFFTLSVAITTKGMVLKLRYLYHSLCLVVIAVEMMKRKCKSFIDCLDSFNDDSSTDATRLAERYKLCARQWRKDYENVKERFKIGLDSFKRVYDAEEINSVYNKIESLYQNMLCHCKLVYSINQLETRCNSIVSEYVSLSEYVIDDVYIPSFITCFSDDGFLDDCNRSDAD